jgi:hypothetical protein
MRYSVGLLMDQSVGDSAKAYSGSAIGGKERVMQLGQTKNKNSDGK